jgi:hypothetical protein
VPKGLTGFTELLPVVLGLLLRPAGAWRDIGFYWDPDLGDEAPAGIKDEGADALRADVDSEK